MVLVFIAIRNLQLFGFAHNRHNIPVVLSVEVPVSSHANLSLVASNSSAIRGKHYFAGVVFLYIAKGGILWELEFLIILVVAPFVLFVFLLDLPNIEGCVFIEPLNVHLAVANVAHVLTDSLLRCKCHFAVYAMPIFNFSPNIVFETLDIDAVLFKRWEVVG